VAKHMRPKSRPFRGCLPRDILDLVVDSCRYHQVPINISPQLLDDAAQAYFVDLGEQLIKGDLRA